MERKWIKGQRVTIVSLQVSICQLDIYWVADIAKNFLVVSLLYKTFKITKLLMFTLQLVAVFLKDKLYYSHQFNCLCKA